VPSATVRRTAVLQRSVTLVQLSMALVSIQEGTTREIALLTTMQGCRVRPIHLLSTLGQLIRLTSGEYKVIRVVRLVRVNRVVRLIRVIRVVRAAVYEQLIFTIFFLVFL